MFRGGAAKLMQHSLTPVAGQTREDREVSKRRREVGKHSESEGRHVIQLLLAVASSLSCFHIPSYAHS